MTVTQKPRARLDLLEQFVYFGEQGGVDLAERYLAAVEATCRQLLGHPHSGVLYDSGIERLTELRRFPVKGFEAYIIFYLRKQGGGLDVIRVLHGARDIDGIFAHEES